MAEGIRIQPRPDLGWPDDANVCVTDHSRPLRPPTNGQSLADLIDPCRSCGQRHFAKTYHIQLRAGSTIVSTTVWDRLQRLDDNPFVYANPVPEPPGQIIRPDMTGKGHRVELVEKFQMPIITKPRRP